MKINKFYSVIPFLIIIKIACENMNETNNETLNENNTNSKNFNLTIDEMDKMIFCSIFVQQALRKDRDRIELLSNISNIPSNITYEKIGADIMKNCLNKLSMKIVNTYFKNLTYLGNYKWKEEFLEYISIDYDKYNDTKGFEKDENDQLLIDKYEYAREKFRLKQEEDRNKMYEEQNKMKIGNFDLENIPSNFRGVLFVIVYLLIFGVSILILRTLINKPKSKKDKNDKKDKKDKKEKRSKIDKKGKNDKNKLK